MTLSDITPDIFVINLDRRTDRLEAVQAQARKFQFMFTRVQAVDGQSLEKPSTRLRPGEQALLLSHYLTLQYALQQGFDRILVLEDDIECVDDMNERLDKELVEVPDDWDVLYLGANHRHLGAGSIPAEKVTDNVMRLRSSFTTHALLIRNTVFDVVIEKIKRMDVPLDVLYAEIQQEKNAYGFARNLIKQADSVSDILGWNPGYNKAGIFD